MERRKDKLKQKIIMLRNTAVEPLSEADIVGATLEFANGAMLDLRDLVAVFDYDSEVVLDPCTGDEAIEKAEALFAAEMMESPRSVEQLRREARTFTRDRLHEIVNRPMVAEDLDGITDQDLFPYINPRPYLRKVPSGITLAFYYSFVSDLSLVRLGEILFEDTERPFHKKLCQCQLPSCGIFFFEVKPSTGRPQRRYCSEKHMLEAHDNNAAKRLLKAASSAFPPN